MIQCVKCGQSLTSLIFLALIQDAGGKVHPGTMTCTADGGKHDIKEVKDEREES